jgi:hypothetical protein
MMGYLKITPLTGVFVNRWKTYSSKTTNTPLLLIKVNGEINISIDGLN